MIKSPQFSSLCCCMAEIRFNASLPLGFPWSHANLTYPTQDSMFFLSGYNAVLVIII